MAFRNSKNSGLVSTCLIKFSFLGFCQTARMQKEEVEKWRIRADIAVEFLEVAFHSILYYCSVYPKAIFCLKRKYQLPVHVSRHPKVNAYITESLKTIRWLLEKDGVRGIFLVILDGYENPLERFCFDFEPADCETSDEYFVQTEEAFREYLLKLSVSHGESEESENKSFRVEVVTREQSSVRLNESSEQSHFPWIESEGGVTNSKFRIFPLKTLDNSIIKLNMYMEKGSDEV
ncbi:hypothetical protein RUM43_007539 [Polyplax serrata]|uniref:HORMA domain-containing protein n=1 Tax=Polyplax serrata TaxID=468196 RepID=A0AAN8PMU9_POLSC